ncbi:DNA-binding NarL/FixJ family response regulator [Pedobacter sp. AK017]|nr:DNA-binding NarL/FixJ family response regulator [Pedobacter sp. AK017]
MKIGIFVVDDHAAIAEKLFISIPTVNTHRKRAKTQR